MNNGTAAQDVTILDDYTYGGFGVRIAEVDGCRRAYLHYTRTGAEYDQQLLAFMERAILCMRAFEGVGDEVIKLWMEG